MRGEQNQILSRFSRILDAFCQNSAGKTGRVEIGQARLDHDYVCALSLISAQLPQGFPVVGRVLLVCLLVWRDDALTCAIGCAHQLLELIHAHCNPGPLLACLIAHCMSLGGIAWGI